MLTEKKILVVDAVVENFYKVVPHEFKTYCALTAHIIRNTLNHFGIEARLLPCQVWVVTPDRNYIVGFVGQAAPGKWDGHVVCSADTFLIDAALRHFAVEFGLTVPSIAVTQKFLVPSQVISRLDLDLTSRLWWYMPPDSKDIDLTIPPEPPERIAQYSGLLIERISNILALTPEPVAQADARSNDVRADKSA